MRLGIIGGAGWIGQALARSAIAGGWTLPGDVLLCLRSAVPEGLEGLATTRDPRELAEACDMIVLSVRPQDWPGLDFTAPGKVLVSVMAGIAIAQLTGRHGAAQVVRALPNAAISVGRSYTPFVACQQVGETARREVRALFETCGTVDEMVSEAQLEYLCGLSGTGPAYPALLASAMIGDAIRHGIAPDCAARAVNAMFVGAGRLIEAGEDDPEATLARFRSYQGVTAAGLAGMQAAGFDAAVSAGLAQAARHAFALGKES